MLLLAEARKLTCQIEANVNATISSPAQQQMGASVIGNGSLQRGSITDNYLTSVVKQITNVIDRTKRSSDTKKKSKYVKFDAFIKDIQPDLILRKQ